MALITQGEGEGGLRPPPKPARSARKHGYKRPLSPERYRFIEWDDKRGLNTYGSIQEKRPWRKGGWRDEKTGHWVKAPPERLVPLLREGERFKFESYQAKYVRPKEKLDTAKSQKFKKRIREAEKKFDEGGERADRAPPGAYVRSRLRFNCILLFYDPDKVGDEENPELYGADGYQVFTGVAVLEGEQPFKKLAKLTHPRQFYKAVKEMRHMLEQGWVVEQASAKLSRFFKQERYGALGYKIIDSIPFNPLDESEWPS